MKPKPLAIHLAFHPFHPPDPASPVSPASFLRCLHLLHPPDPGITRFTCFIPSSSSLAGPRHQPFHPLDSLFLFTCRTPAYSSSSPAGPRQQPFHPLHSLFFFTPRTPASPVSPASFLHLLHPPDPGITCFHPLHSFIVFTSLSVTSAAPLSPRLLHSFIFFASATSLGFWGSTSHVSEDLIACLVS